MLATTSVSLGANVAFDPACNLVLRPAATPGYHTSLLPGTPSHPIRESIKYAHALFAGGEPWEHERARAILTKILELQEQDPTSKWFGLWGWFLEEPPKAMAPADWNWADFIGTRLAEILAGFPHLLSPGLLEGSRAALCRAAWCIFRRNVQTDYTNICAMGAAVCLAAGELLGDAVLLDYGLRRLRNLRRQLESDGGFNEYNSSTYTLVALIEFERILGLVQHADTRAEAETLLHHTWRMIAAQFHPGTGQWAGPACRSYHDWLDAPRLNFLKQRLGFSLPYRTGPVVDFFADGLTSSHPRPCPEEFRARFRALPADPHVFSNCWYRTQEGAPAQVSTTWFTEDATLGSMNRESVWGQGRVVLGYWRTAEDLAVRVQLRILHDGRDFASSLVWNDQEGPHVLTGVHFVTGMGDFHPTLDAPADGIFRVSDLRLRYEVEGHGLKLEQTGERTFLFTAGPRRAVVHAGPGWFDGQSPDGWESGQDGEKQWVDFVFHRGAARDFDPATAGESSVAVALELLAFSEAPSPSTITTSTDKTHRNYHWPSDRTHHVQVPLRGSKTGRVPDKFFHENSKPAIRTHDLHRPRHGLERHSVDACPLYEPASLLHHLQRDGR